jgi:hypothetical protein
MATSMLASIQVLVIVNLRIGFDILAMLSLVYITCFGEN